MVKLADTELLHLKHERALDRHQKTVDSLEEQKLYPLRNPMYMPRRFYITHGNYRDNQVFQSAKKYVSLFKKSERDIISSPRANIRN